MSVSRRKLFALDFCGRAAGGDPWFRVHRTAMGCRFEVTLSREQREHLTAAADALSEADRVDGMLSVFRGDTQVSELNRLAGSSTVAVAPELFALIERCVRLHAVTDGAFDITSTPLSRCWGFLKTEGQAPEEEALAAARDVVGIGHVQLNRSRRVVRFERPGVELNFGAIGKGYAVDRMAYLLRGAGVSEALISAGHSSVFALGGPNGGWLVDVRSPLLATERLARIALRRGALGTSGAGEEDDAADGTRYGHVIDPRTGLPAEGILSSTVITREAAVADALSTAFLIGGPDLARRYCEAHDNTLALLVLNDDARTRSVFGRYPGARIEA